MPKSGAIQTVQNKLVSGVLWIGIGKVVSNVLGILSTLILARLLTPADFGLVAIAISVVGLISVVSELSLSAALVHLKNVEEAHFDTAWTFNFIRGVTLAAIVLAASYIIVPIYDEPELQGLLIALSFSVIIGALYNPKLIVFNRDLIFWQESVVGIVGKLASFATAVLIAYLYQSYWALILGYIASQAVTTIASYWLKPYRPRWTFSKYKDLLSFSLWLTLGRVAQAFAWRSDPILLGLFMPVVTLGFINVGQRFSNLIINEIIQPIGQVLFPAFATMQDEPSRLRDAYLRSTGFLCLISFPVGIGTALIAAPFVRLFLGENWLPVIPVLQVWALSNVWRTIQRVQPLAMALGKTKQLFYRDFRILVVRLPLVLGGLWVGHETGWGMVNGVIWGHFAASVINSHWNMVLVSQISEARMIDQYNSALVPLLAVCGMTVMVILFGWQTAQVEWLASDFAKLTSSVLVGGISYAATLIALWFARGKPKSSEYELAVLVRNAANRFF